MSIILPVHSDGISLIASKDKTVDYWHMCCAESPAYLGCIEITNDTVIFHKYEQPYKVGYWEMKFTDTGLVIIRYWNGKYVLFHRTGRNTTRSRNSYEFVRFIGE